MNNMQKQLSHTPTLFLFILLSTLTSVGLAADGGGEKKQNPFTPKAFVIRYWDVANLAAANTLYTRLPEFCSAAHLLCFPDVRPSLAIHGKYIGFAVYHGENFTNYGSTSPCDSQNFTSYGMSGCDGLDEFKSYSDGLFSHPVNDFRRYSRHTAGHNESFTSYADNTNEADQSFHTYGTGSASGSGEFKEYTRESNASTLRFATYSVSTTGREQTFSSYSQDGKAGDQSFTIYGKNSFYAANHFTSYGTDSNAVGSGFSSYAGKGASSNDTFTNYGVNMNDPSENFKNYANGSTFATESFANYRDQANVGDDSFTSYAKNSRGAHVDFNNYGNSPKDGTDTFKEYAKGADLEHQVAFKGYGVNNTFKDYAKDGVSFAGYTNSSSATVSGSLVKKWVDPGKFFRERMLKEGIVMPMPDIRDKFPERSFLPRSILTKLPFASSRIDELKRVFRVSDNSSMDKMIVDSLSECERKPSPGESKRCVGSLEDMIDFASSVLGPNVMVRSTENVNGSKKNVMVGRVRGINGGKVTKSVSCHQSLFPYLLYYCHSVPKVRVYEADLLNPDSRAKINHGVAICHLDTTAWSPTHGAFLTLGSGPGRIEVCHWIFENDMTCTIAD